MIRKAIQDVRNASEKELSKELASTAAMIARDAKKYAPIDTGNLRKSIGWERLNSKNVVVFAKAPYAPYVEFGTGRVVTLKWLKSVGMPETYASQFKGRGAKDGTKVYIYARPYLFPAAAKNFELLAGRLEKLLNK